MTQISPQRWRALSAVIRALHTAIAIICLVPAIGVAETETPAPAPEPLPLQHLTLFA